jgi:hypothetical protein
LKNLALALFLVLYVLSAQSCLTLSSHGSFQIPNNRFQASETSGALGNGFIAAGYGSKTTVLVADGDLPTDQAILDSARVKSSEGLFFLTSLGLHRKVDFMFYNGATGLKFQALGTPASEAKVGNLSLSLGLAADRGSVERSGYLRKAKAEYTGIDAMILTGYRVQDNQLLYGNLTYSNFIAKGSVTKESRDAAGATTSTTVKPPGRSARETSLLLGWQGFSNQAYLMFETGYTVASLDGRNTDRRLALGGTLGVRW